MEVVQKANEFIIANERKKEKELLDNRNIAEHRANSCGCPNCKKEAESATEAYRKEKRRLYSPPLQFDHEEVWIEEHKL